MHKTYANEQQIINSEFEEFMQVLKEDIDSKDRRGPFDHHRTSYDTPFHDGNKSIDLGEKDTTINPGAIVCIENRPCTHQSEINYVAQGMYSAATGQSIEDGLNLIKDWNEILYDHPASFGEEYWFTVGYDYYKDNTPKQ